MAKQQTQKTSARDLFAYLLFILALIVSVVSILNLTFDHLNLLLPDAQNYWREGTISSMRSSIATLLIMWPVALYMGWFVERDLQQDPKKKDLRVRKWLLHLLVFASALTIIISLIALVNTFLNGELTLRFLLKVISLLLVAGVMFWYERWEINRSVKPKAIQRKVVAAVGSVVVAALIVGGFFVVGSPTEQRERAQDQMRINNLAEIQSEIITYVSREGVLPDELATLEAEMPTDPVTEEGYTYRPLDERSFELCAQFKHKSTGKAYGYPMIPSTLELERVTRLNEALNDWSHEAGTHCFKRELDEKWFEEVEETL